MRRLSVVLAFVLVVAAPVAAAGRPVSQVSLDQVCRAGDTISFTVSWTHVHPQLTTINVWGGTSWSDPGGRWLVTVTDRHATSWSFDVPGSWFEEPGYVWTDVSASSRRISYIVWMPNAPIEVAAIPACPST